MVSRMRFGVRVHPNAGGENNLKNQNSLLTHSRQWHRIAPNMLKSIRWFAFYFYYGFRNPVAVGGA
jgi:hypothetical protein